ncbi:hypothetical protein F469_01440 [Pseudomonas sp. URMO17WK12:I2]|jgi:hypothetical protein|nr:hypothetical protein F469_01440 [Pseudomonas sp. URMO17WK12:I2]
MLGIAPDYMALLNLQEELNLKLKSAYECEIAKGEEHLADFLIDYVENLANELNKNKWSFGRYEYSGDKSFRQSEQWWSDGDEPGKGTILHFIGFSVQVESLT